jgi:pyridoxamine 5'-phosphate oxidase
MSIADLRREYNLAGLRRRDLAPDPMVQFKSWFDQAAGVRASGRLRKRLVRIYKAFLTGAGSEAMDINAMTLATADKDGNPSARIVLLKGIDERGFVFFTNYESRKGHDLAQNPRAALVFYWADSERQVCVAGQVNKLTDTESETYFKSRPRGSRLAAWASNQSEVLPNRAALESKWREIEKKYPHEEVPKPPHWGGYLLLPARIEFWQGRPSRLHDRFRYTRQIDNTWIIERLSP